MINTNDTDKVQDLNYALKSMNSVQNTPILPNSPQNTPFLPNSPQKNPSTPKNKALLDKNGVFHPNEGIFANNAPSLWAVGLPVMPLRPRSKEAFIWGWQGLKERMPTPEEQTHWLHNYMDNNIGLPLGPQSGCIAIDIDTNDTVLINIIQNICGYSPWERVGSKGKVLLYKYNGQKGCKIRDFEGKIICEILSAGNQIVLPPSIHPNTQAPYTSNMPLELALPQLRSLPENIETLLRNAFQDAGYKLSHSGWTRATDYVSQGSRDIKMTAIAGLFANGVTKGELTLLEAMDRMRAWKVTCVEHVAGDDVDIEKGIRNLIQFLIQDVTGPKGKTLPLGWDTGITPEQKKEWGLNFSEEHTEWSVSQVLSYLRSEFEKFEDENDPRRGISIEFVLQRIIKSPSLTALDVDRIFTYIRETNKKTMTKPALRNRLSELRKGALMGTDHTEIAHAVIAEMERSGELKFFQDRFWQWKGSNWEVCENWKILRTIATTFGTLPACRKSSDHWGICQTMKSLVPNTELDLRKVHGVNFANGFVTQDGELLPHHKDYGCTYTLPYRYLPELADQHPQFDKFLYSVWGHCPDYETRVRALQEVICATFFGMGTSFARAVLLYGIAGSGKSQLLDIVRYLMPPETVTYVTPYKFDETFAVTELTNSLMNVCGELNEMKPIPGAFFKSIIDGSSLQGARKFGQPFSFSPVATHWFASNYLPRTRDVSEGFNRRWLIFSFDRPVKKENKVRDIGQLIAVDEREGITAWATSIVRDLTKKGDYTIPVSHKKLINNLSCENDTVFFYLTSEEGPRLAPTNSMTQDTQSGGTPNQKMIQTRSQSGIQVQQLYEKYSSFCYAVAHAKPVGLRMFLMRLTELSVSMGFQLNGLMVTGLTLK